MPEQKMPGKRSYRVVILGGGMAGISAAHYLAAHGVKDILVLEARERLGGRIFTVSKENKPLELGAQWIQGGSPANSVFNLGNSFGLLGDEVRRLYDSHGSEGDTLHWPNAPGYLYRSDGSTLSEEASRQVYDVFNAVRDEARHYYRRQYRPNQNGRILRDKTKLLSFYTTRCRQALDAMRENRQFGRSVIKEVESGLASMANCLSLVAGEDLNQCRLELIGAAKDLPGGYVIVPEGVLGLIDSMSRELPKGSVLLDRRATLIDWSLLSREANVMDKVLVEASSADGEKTETFYADYVISTLPVGVLRRNHKQFFYPGLDGRKIDAFQKIGNGHLANLFFEWQRPWWARGEGGITLIWSAEEMRNRKLPQEWVKFVTGFSEVEGQPNLLVCWVAGSGARVVDQLEDRDIIAEITWLLQRFTGDPGLPPPLRLLRHSWSEDPLCLGAISFPTLMTEEAHFETLSAPLPSSSDPRLLFAGEATVAEGFGTMHGARLSGIREAKRVVERLAAMEKMTRELSRLTADWQQP